MIRFLACTKLAWFNYRWVNIIIICIILLSLMLCSHQLPVLLVPVNNSSPVYFAPMWPKSYHGTEPPRIFLCHLVHHRTLSKTLLYNQLIHLPYVLHEHVCRSRDLLVSSCDYGLIIRSFVPNGRSKGFHGNPFSFSYDKKPKTNY